MFDMIGIDLPDIHLFSNFTSNGGNLFKYNIVFLSCLPENINNSFSGQSFEATFLNFVLDEDTRNN